MERERARARRIAQALAVAGAGLLVGGCTLIPGGLDLPVGDRSVDDPPSATDHVVIEVGETRADLVSRLGEPAESLEWIKQDEGVFGPIESFWAEVPLGATVEIWRFPVEGGAHEVYFVDGSATVMGTAFAPEGVVY